MSFAEGTSVPVSKTRGEIEALVEKYGATRFASGWTEDNRAAISFAARGRMLRFVLPLPSREEVRVKIKESEYWRHRALPEARLDAEHAGELRRRWRCLLLALKAKLEVVESGIESFDEAFLAHIVTDGNLTVYEALMVEDSPLRLLGPAEGHR